METLSAFLVPLRAPIYISIQHVQELISYGSLEREVHLFVAAPNPHICKSFLFLEKHFI
jgi:hypothetical protein